MLVIIYFSSVNLTNSLRREYLAKKLALSVRYVKLKYMKLGLKPFCYRSQKITEFEETKSVKQTELVLVIVRSAHQQPESIVLSGARRTAIPSVVTDFTRV